jgi:SAM-dependent methyltransferase
MPLLVAELNRLYHEREAAVYECTHPEIFEQLPAKWLEMTTFADCLHAADGKLSVLDFGCGTGFEARQCLETFAANSVERMVCYDPSTHMLDQCRGTLAKWRNKVEFVGDLGNLIGGFNLLLTNSVLHHLVDPVRAIREIEPLLTRAAVWLCGHEPSRRFVGNPECRSVLRRYRVRHQWQRLLSPSNYVRRLQRWASVVELPEDYAARRAFEEALFERQPPGHLVGGLVDFHVIEDESALREEKGLDFRHLQAAFAGEWDLEWRRTYSFLGPHYEGRLPARWQRAARGLAEAYPDDGANCCLVWRRSPPQ